MHTQPTTPTPDIGNTQLNGKDVEAIADRAHVWSLWGKTDRAICGYEQALRLSPPHPEVHLLRLAEECLRTSTELTWQRGRTIGPTRALHRSTFPTHIC